jgi:transcriptional regulator with XRE-family HTH domain
MTSDARKAARVMAGLTQAQLSIEAGFNPRAARYWESRGNKPPTNVPSTLQAIEAVLRRYGVELGSKLINFSTATIRS